MEKHFKHENGSVMVITDVNHLSIMERFGYKEIPAPAKAPKKAKTEQK